MARHFPRDPTRRNRKIGTSQAGTGLDNRFAVPMPSKGPWPFYESLGSYYVVRRTIHGRDFPFVVEHTRRNSVHACTVDDLARMLSLLPATDTAGLCCVVLRQPTRKQQQLRGVWGRIVFSACYGRPQESEVFMGPAIVIEAVDPGTWTSTFSTLDGVAELERLREDGHLVEKNKHRARIHSSLETIRVTQLYRTLLHEIGHWVDYSRLLPAPSQQESGSPDGLDLTEEFWQRPRQERERIAHAYTTRELARLRSTGQIPFPRIFQPGGLRNSDFLPRDDEAASSLVKDPIPGGR